MPLTKSQGCLYLLAFLVVLSSAVTVWALWPQQPLYVPGVLLLLCVLAWIMQQPLRGVYLMIVAVGLLPQAPQEIGFREMAFLAILGTTLIAWLSRKLLRQRLTIPASSIATALLTLFAVFLLSLPIALARGTTFSEWARGLAPFVPMLVFFVVVDEAREIRTYRRLLWAFILVGGWLAAQTALTYWQERLWEPIFIQDYGLLYRRVTWLIESSTSPLILAGALIALVEALLAKYWLKQLAFWILVLFLGGAVTLTLSRSEIVVLALTSLGIVFMLFAKRRLRLTRLVLQIGILGLWASVIVLSTPLSPLWELIQSRGQLLAYAAFNLLTPNESSSIADVNILARMNEYRIAFDAFSEQPLVGQGLGYSYEISPIDLEEDVMRVQYVHNIIAYFLMTTGLWGTGVFMILVIAVCAVFWRKYWRESSTSGDRVLIAAMGALVALGLYSFFFAVFRTLGFNLFVGVALALLVRHRPSRERAASM